LATGPTAEEGETLLGEDLDAGRVWWEEELGGRREESATLEEMDEPLVMEDERLVGAGR